ncbi:MAG: hypothetical protein K1W38_04430 [Lachnospiraceae bacterium]
MVTVIKYGPKRRIKCKHCESILEFEKEDIKSVQTDYNEYENQIHCPVCGETITVKEL